MKKISLIALVPLLLVMGTLQMLAGMVSPYKVDLNSPVSTEEHSFKVASNWGHVVSSFSDDGYGAIGYYVAYNWSATIGRGNSGGLEVGDQNHVGTPFYSGKTTDLLVTPKITGTSSIYVKQTTSDGTVKFYTVVQVGSSLKKDRQIDVALPGLSCDGWVKVDVPSLSGEYLGIYGSDVIFDDFEAESAELDFVRGLKIKSVENNNPKHVDCDADGAFTFQCAVELQNTGDYDLNPGDEGFSLSVVDYRDAKTPCFTVPIGKAIAAGATATVSLSGRITQKGEITATRYDIYENITHTVCPSGIWVSPVAYKPVLRVTYNDATLVRGASVSWGTVNSPVSKDIVFHNDGAAPLSVSSVSVPEGYSVDAGSLPAVIAPHSERDVVISLLGNTAGEYSGNVVISADGLDDFSFGVTGTVVAKNRLFVNFEDGKMPAGTYSEGGWSVVQRDAEASGNVYMLCNATSLRDDKFVTPLLDFSAGEGLTLDVARADYDNGGDDVLLDVFYSADRMHWTLAQRIPGSELSGERISDHTYNYGKLTPFSVGSIPSGKYYVAFAGTNTCIDNILGPDIVPVSHDVMFGKCVVPGNGTVNRISTASATLVNRNAAEEKADSYSLSLVLDGTPVAQARSVDLQASSDAVFEFSFVPHTPGSHEIYVLFKNLVDGYMVSTEKVVYTVSPESASAELTVGEGTGVSRNTPICWYNADNEKGAYCDVVYGPDMLKKYGMSKGDVIRSVSFEGNPQNDADFSRLTLEARVALVDSASFVPGSNIEAMPSVMVYDAQKLSLSKGNKFTTTITFPDPLVWDGTSAVRLYTRIDGNGKYCTVTYCYDSSYGKAYYRRGNETDYRSEKAPIAMFTVEKPATVVSGLVTCNETPVPNVVLTFCSGDVIYNATSDDSGYYRVSIYQPGLEYSLTAVADGYSPYTAEIPLLTESEVTYNISLSKIATSLTPSDAESSDSGVYYNVYGQPVSKDYKGIVIIRGKKILNL